MKSTPTASPDTLVPVADAASRLGYRDAQHFRQTAAPRLGITPVLRATRWHVWQSQLDAALSALAAGKDSQ